MEATTNHSLYATLTFFLKGSYQTCGCGTDWKAYVSHSITRTRWVAVVAVPPRTELPTPLSTGLCEHIAVSQSSGNLGVSVSFNTTGQPH
jgi:hypothetical protein